MMKVKLATTKEMAAEHEPNTQDQLFLDEREVSFPISMIPTGVLDFPLPRTPGQEVEPKQPEKKASTKGYSDIASEYLLRSGPYKTVYKNLESADLPNFLSKYFN